MKQKGGAQPSKLSLQKAQILGLFNANSEDQEKKSQENIILELKKNSKSNGVRLELLKYAPGVIRDPETKKYYSQSSPNFYFYLKEDSNRKISIKDTVNSSSDAVLFSFKQLIKDVNSSNRLTETEKIPKKSPLKILYYNNKPLNSYIETYNKLIEEDNKNDKNNRVLFSLSTRNDDKGKQLKQYVWHANERTTNIKRLFEDGVEIGVAGINNRKLRLAKHFHRGSIRHIFININNWKYTDLSSFVEEFNAGLHDSKKYKRLKREKKRLNKQLQGEKKSSLTLNQNIIREPSTKLQTNVQINLEKTQPEPESVEEAEPEPVEEAEPEPVEEAEPEPVVETQPESVVETQPEPESVEETQPESVVETQPEPESVEQEQQPVAEEQPESVEQEQQPVAEEQPESIEKTQPEPESIVEAQPEPVKQEQQPVAEEQPVEEEQNDDLSLTIKKISEIEDAEEIQYDSERKSVDDMSIGDLGEDITSELHDDYESYSISKYIDSGDCQEILNKYSTKKISIDDPEYNKFKMCQEKTESKFFNTEESKNIPSLYPLTHDLNFQKKISLKREFYESKYDVLSNEDIQNIEEKVDEFCNKKIFELSPHQTFVKNFMSEHTPYNSLLLYHGLGTGKTCSSILIAEETRKYLQKLKIKKKIIVVASPAVQTNYKKQLFDPDKLRKVGGVWDIKSCTGTKIINEINPLNIKMSEEKLITYIKKIIRKSYQFMGYNKFANYINFISNKYGLQDEDSDQVRERKIRLIKNEFSNRLIIIDEVQNIRNVNEGEQIKESSNKFLELVKYSNNLKLILLTATPMFNEPQEIIWLTNLLNINDGRSPISVSDVFDRQGNFIVDSRGYEVGRDNLKIKLNGYVSYVRGENPFTFPNAIYPNDYDSPLSIKYKREHDNWTYPELQMNDKPLETNIQYTDLALVEIGDYQSKCYNYIIHSIKSQNDELKEQRDTIRYILIDGTIQSLNISFPNIELDENVSVDYKKLYGKTGLSNVMETENARVVSKFSYKPEILKRYGRFFSPDEIGKYSSKIGNVIESIKNSKGIVIIYSQYIYGGCVPIALALEELGMSRYYGSNFFAKKPKEAVDAITLETKSEFKRNERKDDREFLPAKYAMITGDSYISKNNKKELFAATKSDNINGEKVRVIIISKAGSEGLDFKNVRQIHIVDPWYNLMRAFQTIGRGIRNLSHCSLPYIERNTQIFLYGTNLEDGSRYEAMDLYLWRNAEIKGIKIGKVSRLLKEIAIDCNLNYPQTHMFKELLNKKVRQELSTNNEVIEEFPIGDRENSIMCDFMECDYKCSQSTTNQDKIDETTYNDYYMNSNSEVIISKIKDLYRDKYSYKKEELINEINKSKIYPIDQINAALEYLINKNEKIVDMLGRVGILKNVDDIYLFHLEEYESKAKLVHYEIKKPNQIKENKLQINLDNEIKNIETTNTDLDNFIYELNKEYSTHYKYIFQINNVAAESKQTTLKVKTKKEINIETINIILELLKKYTINGLSEDNDEQSKKESSELLLKLFLFTKIDKLPFDKMLHLFKYDRNLTNIDKSMFNNNFNEYITSYFEKNKITITEEEISKDYYIFNKKNRGTRKNINNILVLYYIEDNTLIEQEINKNIFKRKIVQKYNTLSLIDINFNFGFIGDDKNIFHFKIKELDNKNKGKKCSNIGNKSIQIKYINDLHNLFREIDTPKYDKKNGMYVIFDEISLPTFYPKPHHICLEIEIVLRYFDKIRLHGKRWFFNQIENTLYNCGKLPKTDKISKKYVNT